MKFLNKFYKILILTFILHACEFDKQTEHTYLRTTKDSVYYSMGVIVANEINKKGFSQIDYEKFMEGIKDYFENNLQISLSEASYLANKIAYYKTKQINTIKQQSSQKLTDYLDLEGGIKYKIIKQGKGKRPTPVSVVQVKFEGRLSNGNVFVSTKDETVKFVVNKSIKGWQIVLQHMPEGSKWDVFIPSELAFGSKGTKTIPPHENLFYTIELVKVE